MNLISNIWNHPKTSPTGLLIAIATIAGTLSQQGIGFGTVGKGTVVTLAGALATAMLGLVAQDPVGGRSSAGSTSRLGAWAMIALLLPLPFVGGCSGGSVAQDIVNWTPTLQSTVATVDATGATLEPVDAPVFAAATVGFDAASNLLVGQAKAYLANPGASTLTELQIQVVALQQQVNAALLQVAKITDPSSQQRAIAAVEAVGTVVNAMLGLLQSVSSKAAVAQMAAQARIKMAAVKPYLQDARAAEMVAGHYGEPVKAARMQVERVEQGEVLAGF